MLRRAGALARASQRMDLAVLCLNYIGIARVEARRPRRGSSRCATASRWPSPGAITRRPRAATPTWPSCCCASGAWTSSSAAWRDGLAFTRERGFWSHAYNLEVHRCLLLLRRGDWDGAEAGLRGGRRRRRRPGDALRLQRAVARAPARPARRPGRRGHARRGVGAGAAPAAAARPGLRGDRPRRVGVAGRASPRSPSGSRRVLLARTEHPGAAPFRGELLRYLARAGLPAESFEGCPPAWAAGLEGDWRAAAAAWRAAGDPYETALELAESGDAGGHRRGAAHARGPARRAGGGRACASACGRWARACRAARAR